MSINIQPKYTLEPGMKYPNRFCFKVSGPRAQFTIPSSKMGGENMTYPFPTYEAILGIIKSIYWKPGINFIIDRVRVMKEIQYCKVGKTPTSIHNGKRSLAVQMYLEDVEYQVEFHLAWDYSQTDLAGDRIEEKHYSIMKRCIEHGCRRNPYLGTSDCYAYVEPCEFGEGDGFYDHDGRRDYGFMYHGIDYQNVTGTGEKKARFWDAFMYNGVIEYPRPDEISEDRKSTFEAGCEVKQFSKDRDNYSGFEEPELKRMLDEINAELGKAEGGYLNGTISRC